MTELTTSQAIDPETATFDDIFTAMAGDAYKRSLSSGARFTDAVPFYAAEVIEQYNKLMRESYDDLTPGLRNYWLTKRSLAGAFINEWDMYLWTGSHPNVSFTQRALKLATDAANADRVIGQADFDNDFTRAIAVVIEEREDDDAAAVLEWLHEHEYEPGLWDMINRFVNSIESKARANIN